MDSSRSTSSKIASKAHSSSNMSVPSSRTSLRIGANTSSRRSRPTSVTASKSQPQLNTWNSISGHNSEEKEEEELLEDGDLKTGYLEKDAALKKLNEELEKKSQEIFKKIEQYSNRCRKNCIIIPEAGDAPPGPQENIFSKYNNDSKVIDWNYCDSKSSRKSEEEEAFSNKGEEECCSSDSGTVSNFSKNISSKTKPVASSPSSSSPDTKDVDLKARKRLQKATESVVKCLQSKLLSYESRMTDLHLQFRQKIQENTMLEAKIRALEDDRERLLKSINGLQSSAEKSCKSAEIAKTNLNLKSQSYVALKKDTDALRREQKQKAATIQNLQTRLNRCMDENERLKQQNRSLQTNMRERQQDDRAVIDELQQKVCQLEQQKSILNATIGKQNGLIKTLRNQKTDRGPEAFY